MAMNRGVDLNESTRKLLGLLDNCGECPSAAQEHLGAAFFARGVPMIVYGNEFGRSQRGNNNPCNLDTVAHYFAHQHSPRQNLPRPQAGARVHEPRECAGRKGLAPPATAVVPQPPDSVETRAWPGV